MGNSQTAGLLHSNPVNMISYFTIQWYEEILTESNLKNKIAIQPITRIVFTEPNKVQAFTLAPVRRELYKIWNYL